MRSLIYFPFGALAVLAAVLVVYREELGYRFIIIILCIWIASLFAAAAFGDIPIESLFNATPTPARAVVTGLEALLALFSMAVGRFKGGYIG